MGLAVVHSRAARGLKAEAVSVEVHTRPGLLQFHIVGLPEKEVRESAHRVQAVITHSGFRFPISVITVNLAPADLPKEGGRFDLPIAIGILIATKQLSAESLDQYEFISEIGLAGTLRPVRGALTAAIAAAKSGRTLIVPRQNALEVSLAKSVKAYSAKSFLEVCEHLAGRKSLDVVKPTDNALIDFSCPDLQDVCGQHYAARALEIVAAGGHHCLLLGSPGSGKTMLANRLPGIMPPLNESEALEVMAVRSLCGEEIGIEKMYRRPFCAPHHTASAAALVGGGHDLRPGEITRAHRGILFLDELPEFQRQALEALREPLETRAVRLSRARGSMEYPAGFQLIAAMNPCPDGSDTDERGRCPCSEARLRSYYRRLSAPFLDRVDLHIRVPRVVWGQGKVKPCEATASVRERTWAAYRRQLKRQGVQNAKLSDADVKVYCRLSEADTAAFYKRIDQLGVSARASNRILRVARTIADLADVDRLNESHLLEAMGYRSMDKLFKN